MAALSSSFAYFHTLSRQRGAAAMNNGICILSEFIVF